MKLNKIGERALEHKLEVGDVIYSERLNCIYFVLGEMHCDIPGYKKKSFIMSNTMGNIFIYNVPVSRTINFTIGFGGVFTGWQTYEEELQDKTK